MSENGFYCGKTHICRYVVIRSDKILCDLDIFMHIDTHTEVNLSVKQDGRFLFYSKSFRHIEKYIKQRKMTIEKILTF